MPSATDLIKDDHRKVEQLIEQFEQSPDRELAERICDELEQHTEMEEQVVYPALRDVDGSLFRDAVEEHREVDELIAQIRELPPGDVDRVAELMVEIKGKVEHHVEDEETEDLPAMEEAYGAEVMEELGSQIEEWKRDRGVAPGAEQGDELVDLTKEELYEKAKEAGVEGRSKMTKEELADEVGRG